MRFIVRTAELVKVVQSLSNVVPSKTTLEILNNILFVLEGNTLKLTATDTEIFQTFSLEVDGVESGAMTVPAKILSSFLREINDEVITFNATGVRVSLETKHGKFQISGESAENFPLNPEVEDEIKLEIEPETFKKAVDKVSFAVSTDTLRHALRGVFVEVSPEGVNFVATDGTKLSKYLAKDAKFAGEKSVILPLKALTAILRTMEISESSEFFIAKHHLIWKSENSELYSRVIEEQYPDYKRVIPNDNDKKLTVNVTELASSLRRILILSNSETHQVRMDLTENTLQVITEDAQMGSYGQETIDCDYSSEEMEIGFNATLLLDTLKRIDTLNVTLNLKHPTGAVLLEPENNEEAKDKFLMIAMPIRISSD